MTTLNFSGHACADSGGDLPAFFGGHCDSIGGPIISSFGEYVQPGHAIVLPWLTTVRTDFRNNLIITNPNGTALTLSVLYRGSDGQTTVMKNYSVPARGLFVIVDLFQSTDFDALLRANGKNQNATATLTGDGPFYAVAAVRSTSPRPESGGRLVIVQPDLP